VWCTRVRRAFWGCRSGERATPSCCSTKRNGSGGWWPRAQVCHWQTVASRILPSGDKARSCHVRLENGVTDQATPAGTGNHALAFSWHGRPLGIPVTVFSPSSPRSQRLRAVWAGTRRSKFWSASRVLCAPQVERCKKFGAKVVTVGNHTGERGEGLRPQLTGLPARVRDSYSCAAGDSRHSKSVRL
jgi:hypothetical protein